MADKIKDRHTLSSATILYYRNWLAFDGVFYEAVRQVGHTDRTIQLIANQYQVARCLSAADSKDKSIYPSRGQLIKALNFLSESENWPPDLVDKAKACINLAKSKDGLFSKRKKKEQEQEQEIFAGSLISKLMWFLKPDDWTVFDNYASKGLKTKGSNTCCRMRNFYVELKNYGFVEISRDMQLVIRDAKFPYFPATRIIDLMLMLNGGFMSPDLVQCENDLFLDLLHQESKDKLISLASQLEEKFGNEKLFHLT